MKWKTVAENWPAFLDRMEQAWPQADRTDLANIEGDHERLVTYLSETLELTPNEAREEIEEFTQGAVPSDVVMDELHDNQSITDSGKSIPVGEDVYSEDRDFGDDRPPEPPVGRKD